MSGPSTKLLTEYTAALKHYQFEGDESALQRAYELGRSALSEGLGVLEMAALHKEAMVSVFDALDGLPATVAAAGQFFAESLSPFEMTHRGYREANSALQASETRYRELFENANDVVFTTDLAGQFTSVNRAGEELTGYRRDEVPAMNLATIVAPEHLPIAQRMLEQKLAGEAERTQCEIEIVSRDGRRIPMELRAAPIYQDGRPVGMHGIARDVTERKRAEQALRQLNERLEEQVRRIAHAIHDEGGQLLGSVHLALEEFARGLPPGANARLSPVRKLLLEIEEQLRRLSHELHPTILDDLGLLPALEFLADRVSKRSGLVITVQGALEEQLPPAMATGLYRSVQEALTNVMRHAQATHVHVEVVQEGDAIRCTTRDDGVGFDVPAVLSRRGDRGLGLIGIRERVGALGGTLTIRSAPGEGTELLITIPLRS